MLQVSFAEFALKVVDRSASIGGVEDRADQRSGMGPGGAHRSDVAGVDPADRHDATIAELPARLPQQVERRAHRAGLCPTQEATPSGHLLDCVDSPAERGL